MSDSMRKRTEALRQEALADLQQSDRYRAVKALDDAVAAMGGSRFFAEDVPALNGALVAVETRLVPPVQRRRRRMSQADGAALVLKEQGRPMSSADLMPTVANKGITVSAGPNATTNFGSTMSRDNRFISVRRDGVYYWWLKGVDLPPPFKNEAPDLPLQVGSDASSFSSQEGGEDHAATTNVT